MVLCWYSSCWSIFSVWGIKCVEIQHNLPVPCWGYWCFPVFPRWRKGRGRPHSTAVAFSHGNNPVGLCDSWFQPPARKDVWDLVQLLLMGIMLLDWRDKSWHPLELMLEVWCISLPLQLWGEMEGGESEAPGLSLTCHWRILPAPCYLHCYLGKLCK